MLKLLLFSFCCLIYKCTGIYPFHWFNYVNNFEPFIENMTGILPLHKIWMDLPLDQNIPDNTTIYHEKLLVTPRIKWDCNNTDFYCLFLTAFDVDFERWGYVQTHHWLVVNIPGNDVDKGNVIFPYIPPKYIKNGPMYRVIVHRQPQKQDFKEFRDAEFNRNGTTFRKFAAEHNFAVDPRYRYLLPFAWKNFFLTNEKYVSIWKGPRTVTPKFEIPTDKVPLFWRG